VLTLCIQSYIFNYTDVLFYNIYRGIFMAQAKLKSSSINIRALASQRTLIDKAATLLHKSRSDFMLDSACQEAINVLLDQRLFFVDEETYKAFLSLLETPVDENQGLKSLLKRKSPWEK